MAVIKIPVPIAEKLLLLLHGEKLPSSSLKHKAIDKMLDDGAMQKQVQGRSKSLYYIHDAEAFARYLKNSFGITDLQAYIDVQKNEESLRANAVASAASSKHKSVRTFKGFLVNCCDPVNAMLNGENMVLHPAEGSFIFIYDYERFVPEKDVVIAGIENPENFRYIRQQRHLFPGSKVLFVSRYPQGKDLVKWLKNIPNTYLHFGDFDFAGIRIYLHEYKKHIPGRASFFIPPGLEEKLRHSGNRDLYDTQLHLAPDPNSLPEPALKELVALLHKYKKVLEQEIYVLG